MIPTDLQLSCEVLLSSFWALFKQVCYCVWRFSQRRLLPFSPQTSKSSGNHREIIGKSSNIPDIVLDMLGPFRAFVILMVQRLGLWPLHINYIKISCILFYHHSPSLQVRYVFVCRVVMLVELMCDHHYGTSSVGAEAPWGSRGCRSIHRFAELWSSDSLFLVACWANFRRWLKAMVSCKVPRKISFGNGEIWQNMANKWILNIGYSFCFTSNFI